MNNKVKIWISLGQESPHYFAVNESSLKQYIDHLNSIGFNGFSYDEDKSRGFVQEFEISEKRLNNINKNKQCYIWLNANLSSHKPNEVIAMSDTMNDVATQVSQYYGKKVSKQHLLTQYEINTKYSVQDISQYSVKSLTQCI